MQPTDPYSDPALINAKNEASTALSNYGTATANALTMPDMLKKALDTKFANAAQNPLYDQQKSALSDYLGATNTGYQSVLPQNNNGMIFSPSSQAEQIQGRRNSALTNLAGINSRIGGGFSGISDIIGQATKSYEAQANTAKFGAEGARQKYTDLLDEITKKEAIRQFNVSETNKSAKAGATTDPIEQLLYQQLLSQIAGGDIKSTTKSSSKPTEKKPTSKPGLLKSADPKRQYHSPQGQWIYVASAGGWIPVTN